MPTNNLFADALYAELFNIPKGRITSYGALAKKIGYPNYARQVGHTLGTLPKDTKLPWYRVVNAQGKSSFPPESSAYTRQVEHLAAEGVLLENGKYPRKYFV